MNSSRLPHLFPILCACFAIGCTEYVADDMEDAADALVDTAEQELEASNALNLNALNLNALNLSALNLNALNLNALEPGALSIIQDPSESGNLARQAIQYMVSCALDPTQS